MKKVLLVLLSAGLVFFSSCGNEKTKSETEETATEETISAEEVIADAIDEAVEEAANESASTSDCDEFVNKFDKWADDYIKVLEKFKTNPTDATVSQEYMESAQEMATWMQEWQTKVYTCTAQEGIQERFQEITDKLDAKMKELGYE